MHRRKRDATELCGQAADATELGVELQKAKTHKHQRRKKKQERRWGGIPRAIGLRTLRGSSEDGELKSRDKDKYKHILPSAEYG